MQSIQFVLNSPIQKQASGLDTMVTMKIHNTSKEKIEQQYDTHWYTLWIIKKKW